MKNVGLIELYISQQQSHLFACLLANCIIIISIELDHRSKEWAIGAAAATTINCELQTHVAITIDCVSVDTLSLWDLCVLCVSSSLEHKSANDKAN